MSLVTLSAAAAGGEAPTIPAFASSVVLTNSANSNRVALPSSGVAPGWSCNIITTSDDAIIVENGAINGNAAGPQTAQAASVMYQVSCTGENTYVVQRIGADGSVNAL